MNKELKYTKLFFVTLLIGVTILIGYSLLWNIHQEHITADEYAKTEAKASYNKDLLYRRWAAKHGGVYVPITEHTPPNPYLTFIHDRDISTANKNLTLINPAYMTRQVYDIANNEAGTIGHITSLNPIRPENKADEWETKTLLKFEKGDTENFELAPLNNRQYMRFMGVMKVEESCLKCHGQQGYKIGDVRGGISVSVPMDKYHTIVKQKIRELIATHILIYIAIVVLLAIGYQQFTNRLKKLHYLQNQLYKSEKAYKDVIETTSDLITVVDENGKLLFVNHASTKFYGLQPAVCIGMQAFDFIFEDDKNHTIENFAQWKNSEITTFYFENRQKSKSGTILPVGWTINIERNNNKISKVTSIGRDISEIKNAEKLLIEKNNKIAEQNTQYEQVNTELNELISNLSEVNNTLQTTQSELETTNSKLLKTNADKDRFISILGHDLRNLFTTTLGFSELLLKKHKTAPITIIESYAQQISNSTTLAYNLLDDLLKWAHAQTGRLAFNASKVNLNTVCTDVIAMFAQMATEKNIELNCNQVQQIKIIADTDMIKTILRNLVSNAIKFTVPGGVVSITAEQSNTWVKVTVADTGVGMTPDALNKLFDVSQTHSTPGTANEHGTGLGLLLCKELVEKHGGTIWVESDLEKGSRFLFTIPSTII